MDFIVFRDLEYPLWVIVFCDIKKMIHVDRVATLTYFLDILPNLVLLIKCTNFVSILGGVLKMHFFLLLLQVCPYITFRPQFGRGKKLSP